MKYFIVDCITGVRTGAKATTDLTKARAIRDELGRQRVAEGGSDDFWIIIDKDGNEIAPHED